MASVAVSRGVRETGVVSDELVRAGVLVAGGGLRARDQPAVFVAVAGIKVAGAAAVVVVDVVVVVIVMSLS